MYYLDMYFPDGMAPDLGSIKLTHVSRTFFDTNEIDAYGKKVIKRLRRYILRSADIDKLSLINNAADGSKAIVADTNEKYILCEGQWVKWKPGGGSEEGEEDWGDIGEGADDST